VFVTFFVTFVSYGVAFMFTRTKHPWIVSAFTAIIVVQLLTLPLGFTLERFLLDTLEWLFVAGIAGLLTMLVPPDPQPRR
jgi:hypothetical protein